MTSLQDDGRPLYENIVMSAISVKKLPDYDEIWYTKSGSDCKGNYCQKFIFYI